MIAETLHNDSMTDQLSEISDFSTHREDQMSRIVHNFKPQVMPVVLCSSTVTPTFDESVYFLKQAMQTR